MTETGYGANVIEETNEHTFQLDENELKKILMSDNIRDLPVVVVAVAGAYRSGKSFLLNLFLRYCTSPPTARADGSWLRESSSLPPVNLKWGRDSTTRSKTGIMLWSEPFVTTTISGEKVAVLLMKTQGLFNSTSTVRDSSTVLTLSALLSSVQIYNLSQNIQEDDLQLLQLAVEYGRLFDDSNGKAFQVLEFLVRDWQFPWDYEYGAAGGDRLLQERLEVNTNISKEMRDIRSYLRSSFDKTSCFLMPHPGFKVLKKTYDGNIGDITEEFTSNLNALASSLFAPEKLQIKTSKGQKLTAGDLFQCFKSYCKLFSGEQTPIPSRIKEVTDQLLNEMLIRKQVVLYRDNMNREYGADKPDWVPDIDFYILHSRYKSIAQSDFISKNVHYSLSSYYIFTEEVDKQGEEFRAINKAKQVKAVNSAKDAYDAKINKATDNGQSFSLEPIQNINSKAFGAALQVYNAHRKRYSTNHDNEIVNFIWILEDKYTKGVNTFNIRNVKISKH